MTVYHDLPLINEVINQFHTSTAIITLTRAGFKAEKPFNRALININTFGQ